MEPHHNRKTLVVAVRAVLFNLLLVGTVFTSATSATATTSEGEEPNPRSITLRASVLITPPFAYERDEYNDSYLNAIDDEGANNDSEIMEKYGGFQPHLLERLQVFAKQQDNIDLNFELETRRDLSYDHAINRIAIDCNTTATDSGKPIPHEECSKYDMVIGDYWCSPERFERVAFSPAWLRTTMSVMKLNSEKLGKKKDSSQPDITTLRDAFRADAKVCALGNSIIIRTAIQKYPDQKDNFVECNSIAECIQDLKDGKCALYTDDELQLHNWASKDPALQVTNEQFNTQYLYWPMSHALDPTTKFLFQKWIYAAIQNSTMDELYREYFQAEVCPGGTAGKHCELFCDPIHGSADKLGNCVCESTRWTGDDCTIEVPEDVNLINSGLKLFGNTMFAINCGLVLFCGTWLYLKRDTPQVKISQPYFLALVLLGCLLSTSTILALGVEDEGDGPVHACMAIPWLYSVGFSITFGTLFAKVRRVYLIFKSASDIRREAVTWQETLLIIAGVLFIDVTVLTIWTIVDPLTWTRTVVVADKFGFPLESYGLCREGWAVFGSIIGVLHILLLGVASYMCYVAREIPGEFSESRYIAMAMISNFQILLIGIPVMVLVGSDPSTSYFVRCTMIWMNDFMVVILIFGNLIYSVHFSVNRSTRKDVKSMIGVAMRRYSLKRSNSMGSNQSSISGLNNDSSMMFQRDGGGSSNNMRPEAIEDPDQGVCSGFEQQISSSSRSYHRKSADIDILPPIPSVGSNTSSFIGDDSRASTCGRDSRTSTTENDVETSTERKSSLTLDSLERKSSLAERKSSVLLDSDSNLHSIVEMEEETNNDARNENVESSEHKQEEEEDIEAGTMHRTVEIQDSGRMQVVSRRIGPPEIRVRRYASDETTAASTVATDCG